MKNPQEYYNFYEEIEKISDHCHIFSSKNNTEKNINIPDAIKNKKVISHNRSFSDNNTTHHYTLKNFIESLLQENSLEEKNSILNISQPNPKKISISNKPCLKNKDSISSYSRSRTSQLKNKHLSFSNLTKRISNIFTKLEKKENNFFKMEQSNVKLIKSIFFSEIADNDKSKIFYFSLYKIEESGIYYLVVHEVEWAQLNNLIKEFQETQSKILASLSHELRTPLNSIIILSKELKSNQFLPKDEHVLAPMLANIKLLSLIVNDLLDFSEITYGKMKILESNFDLEEVLIETIENYKQLADYKNIFVDLRMDSQIGKFIRSDRTRILQILSNLMSNAVKYTEKGNIIIEVKLFPIFQPNPIVEITIEDTGCGFDEVTLKSLGTISNKKKAKLAGLGLTISDYLAKYLAPKDFGGIFTRSEVGKGSLFGFLIENKINEDSASCLSSSGEGRGDNLEIPATKSYISISRTSIAFDRDEMSLMLSDSVPKYLQSNDFKNKFNIIDERNIDSVPKCIISNELKNKFSFDETSISDKAGLISNLNISSLNLSCPKPSNFNATACLTDSVNEGTFSHVEIRRHKTEMKLPSLKILEKREIQCSKLDFMITLLSEKVKNKGCTCYDILIVDDSSFNLKAFQFFLKKFDLFIDTALSGDQAIEKVQNYYKFNQCVFNCKHYKCIFMDVDMPFKDGIQTSKEIFLFGKSVGIDFIIIPWTAFSDKVTLENCKNAGMVDFVSKPHDPQIIKLILTKKVLPQLK